MLTTKQINEITFRKTNFSGYKPEDVNEFIDEVLETVQALTKENQAYKAKLSEISGKNGELREKLQVLARKIEGYREDEEGIKSALLSAQKMGNASLKDAKIKADEIISDANKKADDMIEEAKKKTVDVIASFDDKIAAKQKEFDVIKEEVTNFRSSLFGMYRTHITNLETIPDFSEELEKKKKEAPVQKPTVVEDVIVTEEVEFAEEIEEEDISSSSYSDETELMGEVDEDMFADFEIGELEPEENADITSESFDTIDFNAYSDIPDALNRQKSETFNTLEFGDSIDIRRSK